MSRLTQNVIIEYQIRIREDLDVNGQVELATNGVSNTANLKVNNEDKGSITVTSMVKTATSLFVQKKIVNAAGQEVDSALLGDDDKATYHINLISPKAYSPLIEGNTTLATDVLDTRISDVTLSPSQAAGGDSPVAASLDAETNTATVTQQKPINQIYTTVTVEGTAAVEPGDYLENVIGDQVVVYYKPVELTLKKTDSSNAEKLLPGAQYSAVLYNAANGKAQDLGTLTTDENGEAVLKFYPTGMQEGETWTVRLTETKEPAGYLLDCTPVAVELTMKDGRYLVTETGAPEGYQKDAEPQVVTLDESSLSGEIYTAMASFADSPVTGTLLLTKSDDRGVIMAGVGFTLQPLDAAGQPAGEARTASTQANGVVLFSDVPYGTYTLQELSAPDGYLVDTASHTVRIDSDGVQVVYTAYDAPVLGKIRVSKTDESEKSLDGAVFALTTADGTPVALTADEQGYHPDEAGQDTVTVNGETLLHELPAGRYLLTETAALQGYLRFAEPWAFTVTAENYTETQSASFVNTLITAGVTILKRDALTKTPLSGAVFQLEKKAQDGSYEKAGDPLATGASGRLVFARLAPGDYRLTEVTAPADHLLS